MRDGERVGKADAIVIKRCTDDDAGGTKAIYGGDVLDGADAARGDDVRRNRFDHFLQCLKIWALEFSVPSDVSKNEMFHALRGKAPRRIDGPDVGLLTPSLRRKHAVACVEPDSNAGPELLDSLRDQRRGRDGRRADDDTVDAQPGDLIDILHSADAAA